MINRQLCMFATIHVPRIYTNPSISACLTKGIPAESLGIMRQDGILKPFFEGPGRRPTELEFPELLNIVEGGNVF